ncbi:MAG: hypothetical protein MK135_06100, partial [Polyangiaceae bacterium]|nr:hypothetical protein [Polyangiaceae bacterium]
TESDLYTVPFNDGAGGPATKVPGASDPGVAEYYPDFSADDQLIAYNRAGTDGYIYYRPDGQINVIAAAGGTPTNLIANQPPVCTGESADNVINSWPKWSPSVSTDAAGGKYYWLVFSSARAYDGTFIVPRDYYTPVELDTRSSQLYLTAVYVAADQSVTSYPAVYIWNQNSSTSNLTPAWDEFKIPPQIVR